MIGTKLYKGNKEDMAKYTATAQWCNANNAHITDMGEYYEVVENVPHMPSQEEQIASLDRQYEADKKTLQEYYVEFMIAGDTEGMESIKGELTALATQYDTDIEALKEDEE